MNRFLRQLLPILVGIVLIAIIFFAIWPFAVNRENSIAFKAIVKM